MRLDRKSNARRRDPFQAYYTSDDRLVDYMVRLLDVRDGNRCLEPAAGDGCFVRGLIRTHQRISIDAWELHAETAASLRRSFADRKGLTFLEGNFLTAEAEPLFARRFDRIIANPPYGAWQEPALRRHLKSLFPSLYVKETYGLFLAKSLAKLAPGGRLVFIIPETFLFIHRQQALRELILRESTITSIDIIPSSLFPGVHFGYARLSIIVLENRSPPASHHLELRHCASIEDLVHGGGRSFQISQRSVLTRHASAFPVEGTGSTTTFLDSASLRLGELADCVTGFYSGSDREFLRVDSELVKAANRYATVDPRRVIAPDTSPPLEGITGERCFVPILKGGGHPFFKPVTWHVDWSRAAVSHYRTAPKARFQNSRFYFRRGIGLPMVSSSKPSASVIRPHWMFDQSIVGVFPHQDSHFWFLLALLNSTTCFRLLRHLNPSANNSAKYVKELPIVLPDRSRLARIGHEVERYAECLMGGGARDPELEQRLDATIAAIYALPPPSSDAGHPQPPSRISI